MAVVEIGSKAPDFSLKASDGKTYSLSKLKGRIIVLYFYPKDDTPGCTIESCDFRNNISGFERSGAIVLGVSADDMKSHMKFSNKYKLNFPLLSDVGGKVSRKYGVWVEKSFLGKKFQGIERSTFIIGRDGKIVGAFRKVNPLGHANGMLRYLAMLPKTNMGAGRNSKGSNAPSLKTRKK